MERGQGSAILEGGKESAVLDGKGKESAVLDGEGKGSSVVDTAGKGSAILEGGGKGSSLLEGSSMMEREPDEAVAVEREEVGTMTNLEAPSGEVEGGEDSTPQGESGREQTEGKVKQRKKYVLKGGASALAVQLFGMDDKFEMRSVAMISLRSLTSHLCYCYYRSVDLLSMVFQLFPVSFIMT